jgi:hypothetical protein
VDEAVLVVPEMDVGRFVADVPVTGRLAAAAGVVVFFTRDAFTFSLLLEASGLVIGSSLPDTMLDSTGVAGATSSVSTSAGASARGAEGIGSSVEDIAATGGWTNGYRERYNKGWCRWYFFGFQESQELWRKARLAWKKQKKIVRRYTAPATTYQQRDCKRAFKEGS